MKIINVSKNTVLADDALVAKTILQNAEGLLSATTPRAIVLHTRWGACPIPKSEHTTVRGKLFHIFRNCIHHLVDFPLFWCGVHTFGMRFPIDVVITDGTHAVRKIKCKLQPNRFFFWNPNYGNVLELPGGTVRRSNTAVGDTLVFTEEK